MTEVSEEFASGHLALEFTNTLSWDPHDPKAGEKLGAYQQLLDWSLDRGLVSRKTHGVLAGRAHQHPDDAAGTYRWAIGLRAAMHAIFCRYTDGPLEFIRAIGECLQFGTGRVASPHQLFRGWRCLGLDGVDRRPCGCDVAGDLVGCVVVDVLRFGDGEAMCW